MVTLNRNAAQEAEAWERITRQQKINKRTQRIAQAKADNHLKFVVGELIVKHFPEVKNFKAGTKAENSIEFQSFESFLSALSADQELLTQLKERAKRQQIPP